MAWALAAAPGPAAVSGAVRVAARLAVTWNGRGRPSGNSATASPSSTTSVTGRARTALVISGTRAVMSSSVRVHTPTWSPRRCTWIRTPSIFHSTAAGDTLPRAAATSGADAASIGRVGRPTRRVTARSAAAARSGSGG